MEDTPNFYLMFGRLEGKVDALLTNSARMETRLDGVEGRIDDLENLRHQGLGAVRLMHAVWAAIAACAALFTTQITEYLFG